jgi:uncharacterized cysteine cluster protein YcgN (CxxCxxCC family)
MDQFWRHMRLDQMTHAQWESLCDGCGRCCLQKLKNPTTGKVYYTWVACYLLDIENCRCTGYDLRHTLVPDCIRLEPANIQKLRWLPKTCAYRLIAEGRPLPSWHPLVTKNRASVHEAGVSVRGRAISEICVHPDDLENFLMKAGS